MKQMQLFNERSKSIGQILWAPPNQIEINVLDESLVKGIRAFITEAKEKETNRQK